MSCGGVYQSVPCSHGWRPQSRRLVPLSPTGPPALSKDHITLSHDQHSLTWWTWSFILTGCCEQLTSVVCKQLQMFVSIHKQMLVFCSIFFSLDHKCVSLLSWPSHGLFWPAQILRSSSVTLSCFENGSRRINRIRKKEGVREERERERKTNCLR